MLIKSSDKVIPKSRKKQSLLLIIGFVFFWNTGFIGAEYALPDTAPFTLMFWRYLAITLILFFYLKYQNRLHWPGWAKTVPNMIVGILAHGVWLSCVLLALEQGVPAGIVALVVALQPLATGAFSGIVVGEPTPWHRWLGLIVGFGGVAVAVLPRIDFNTPVSIFGYLIPLGSVIAITAATLIQRKIDIGNKKSHFSLSLSLFYQSLGTAIVVAVPAFLWENLTTTWSSIFITSMIWLVVAVSFGAYALMWLLIERMDATRVASLFYLGPPVTMLMAWIAFGDRLQMTDIIGLIVVFVGVLITRITPETAPAKI